MPTQSRGFFACDHCGLLHDTLEEATEHELSQCPRAAARRQISHLPPPPQQQQQQQQILTHHHQNYFLQQQHQLQTQQQPPPQHNQRFSTTGPLATTIEGTEAYPPYPRATNYIGYRGNSPLDGGESYPKLVTTGIPSTVQTRCFSLVNYPPDHASNNLVVTDKLACQNIEIFEVTREFIPEYERTSGDSDVGSRILPKQVGLRCRNCGHGSNNNNDPSSNPSAEALAQFSSDFPVDLISVGDSVRKIADHHLVSCRMTDPEVQETCQIAANKRQQRKRGLGMTADNDNSKDNVDNDERTSRTALINYCVGFCQQKGIANKLSRLPHNNKSGIEFITTEDSTQAMRGSKSGLVVGGGTGCSYSISQSGHQQTFDPSTNLPFYQESDRTWHCKFCSYIPHQFRDSQSIWSSPRGDAPPNSFIEQHLSMCRVYQQQQQQQNFSLPPGGMLPAPPTSLSMVSYSNHPSSYGIQSHGPATTSSWEASAALSGRAQYPHNLQYSSAGVLPPAHHESNYLYGHPQSLSPGIIQPHMDSSIGGRFLGQSDHGSTFPDGQIQGIGGGSRSVSGVGSTRGSPFGGSGENSTDAMNNTMNFLAQFDKEYYARDPANAAIPKLVLDEDHLLLTDYFFYLMKQLRLCRFTENDRKTRGGKREKIKIGYGGLQCIHCANLPMSRKFFWSNVDRLANSFAEIPGHVLKCRRCPKQNKDALMRLKQGHPDQMSKLPRGSQKIFFRRMWRRLHDGDPQEDEEEEEDTSAIQVQVANPKTGIALENRRPPIAAISTSLEKSLDDISHSGSQSGSITVLSDETILVMQRSAREAAMALALSTLNKSGPSSPSSRILVAIPEDKEWLSDIDAYVRKQLEVFCATEDDVAAAQADRKYPITLGQVGIRCIHCSIAQGHDAIGHAIAYPFSISGVYESVKEFHRLHLDSCLNVPVSTRTKLNSMKGASSLSSVLRKYYTLAAGALGLRDTKDGIRTGGESNSIGSLAAFTFAETQGSSQTKNDEERKLLPGTNSLKQESGESCCAESDAYRGTKRSGSPSATLESENKIKRGKHQLCTNEIE
mmetsp:Transcript_2127/g.2432  ORF Transcript_2127/g.2432 Transcript_2127/m.2432 type:complete len:1061 (-) Transcript_2127:116-3298(-)